MSSRNATILLSLCLLLTSACSPKLSWQAMAQQPRYEAYEDAGHLRHGQSAQTLVEGVLPRGHLQDDILLYTGLDPDGAPSEVFPFAVTRELLLRGQQQYDSFCSPCHDYAGSGQGMLVERGFTPPPSFHTDALRAAPAGHLFTVVTHGLGAMPPYAEQLPVRDRWAVVAYLRALQLSQNATLADVPADQRDGLTVREDSP